jgi:hypothetical protein
MVASVAPVVVAEAHYLLVLEVQELLIKAMQVVTDLLQEHQQVVAVVEQVPLALTQLLAVVAMVVMVLLRQSQEHL